MTEYAQTKPVCQLDADEYFVGVTTADLDPLENNGTYLIPRLCIETEAPELKPGFVAKWVNGEWEYIEDHRGVVVYSIEDGRAIEIHRLGSLPDSTTLNPRPDKYHVFVDGQWTMTAESEGQKASEEASAKQQQIIELLNKAAQKISEYQDLIDFAETDEETAAGETGHKAWRQYRAALLKYQKGLITDKPSAPE